LESTARNAIDKQKIAKFQNTMSMPELAWQKTKSGERFDPAFLKDLEDDSKRRRYAFYRTPVSSSCNDREIVAQCEKNESYLNDLLNTSKKDSSITAVRSKLCTLPKIQPLISKHCIMGVPRLPGRLCAPF
jgi:hypothetical protein